ncbi:PAS domain S-box-containing protein [Kineococcus xinjiangensis]|uniref:PAS domain S-box-containing protein n=1 Tax=Kineococcus xinjiangensis TaxID=512762 RepID=A0A2S6ID82_9ACTN|nr:SpoIIE family protein phosphatase [Kineococcus xinjiangensis]PPK92157.1 PAS domain S-box-containing protein [Kineococcus xinjiangensis]
MARDTSPVDHSAVFAAIPTPYLVMDRDLVIVDANPAYLATTGRTLAEIVGRPVFEAFPGNPSEDEPDGGVAKVRASFERARDTGVMDTMPVQKYDITDGSGDYTERYWSLISVPVPDEDGRTAYVVQRAQDVTDYIHEREGARQERAHDAAWRRIEEVEADLYARGEELRTALAAEAATARRLQGLAELALQLSDAETVRDLAEALVARATAALGCFGGAVAVLDEQRGRLAATVAGDLGPRTQPLFGDLPLNGPLPLSVAAATGRRVLLCDPDEARAWAAEMELVAAVTGAQAWAVLPLTVGERRLGALVLHWRAPRRFPPEDLEILEAFAAQCAQGLDRLQVRQAERAATAASQRLSETLQRSLLTEPPRLEDLQIEVRYQPAAQEAQVGGDWYDAFVVPGRDGTGGDSTGGGSTVLVIGDVAGHDRDAAAAMAQVRNVLRGVAHTAPGSPAVVLSALDRAMADLGVDALATAVLAQVEQSAAETRTGTRTLRWSAAGHPPPLLVLPSGQVEVLQGRGDLLLGLDPDAPRSDAERALAPGTTVLLYTDGLVERRSADLNQGVEWLRETAARFAHLPLPRFCDAILGELPGAVEDDVAVLALRTRQATSAGTAAEAPAPVAVPRPAPPRSAAPEEDRGGALVVLEPAPTSVRAARDHVRACCRAAGVDEDTCDTAVLLASETVTNAFIHGRSEARLRVLATAACVHVEVGDDNARRPVRAERNDAALDGRGLDILDILASSWGVRDEPEGKVVWFQVTGPGDGGAA